MSQSERPSWIKPLVFWPPFIVLMIAIGYSFINLDHFVTLVNTANSWILTHFSWLFNLSTLVLLATAVGVFFSPLASVRIGGENATPLLSRWRWFSVTLCTTIATGILFWGTAEPLYHFHTPPQSLGIVPGSEQAVIFSLSTMFLHWSFTPYAIYTVPALAFALTYYNLRRPFSLGAVLSPVLGASMSGRGGQIVDAIALYSLVAGMAAALGAGVLTLSGGLDKVFGLEGSVWVFALITGAIVATFLVSAVSGLQKGIARLSNLNSRLFFIFCGFVCLFGPGSFILLTGVDSFVEYVGHFFEKSLFVGIDDHDPWPNMWTVFYWANWFAWAPITAMFLGRIARGYTVRQFLVVNLILPALFACLWMSVFSGTTLYFDNLSSGQFYAAMKGKGEEAVIYLLLEYLPFAGVTVIIFIFVTFLSYVTAADSNTDAISHLCTPSREPMPACLSEQPQPKSRAAHLKIKCLWGIIIGVTAWVMISFADVSGIRMMSNLGGLPAMFIIMGINVALIKLIIISFKNKSLIQNSATQ